MRMVGPGIEQGTYGKTVELYHITTFLRAAMSCSACRVCDVSIVNSPWGSLSCRQQVDTTVYQQGGSGGHCNTLQVQELVKVILGKFPQTQLKVRLDFVQPYR